MARKKKSKREAAPRPSPLTVISGGETGADQGGLRAALAVGFATGGIAAQGYRTQADKCQKAFLWKTCGLEECSDGSHKTKDKANVDNSDATIAFRLNIPKSGSGTERTLAYAYRGSYSKWDLFTEAACVSSEDGNLQPSYLRIDSGRKPILVLFTVNEEMDDTHADLIHNFIIENQVRVLNVAGHSKYVLATADVERVLTKAFERIRQSRSEAELHSER